MSKLQRVARSLHSHPKDLVQQKPAFANAKLACFFRVLDLDGHQIEACDQEASNSVNQWRSQACHIVILPNYKEDEDWMCLETCGALLLARGCSSSIGMS